MGSARTAITCFNQSPCFPVVPEDVADGPWRKLVGFPLSKCHEAQLFVLNRGQNISWYAMPGAEHWILVCSCKFDKFMTCLFVYLTILNLCCKEQHDRLLRCGISLAWRQVTCCFSLNSDKKWIAWSTRLDKHLTVWFPHSHVARHECLKLRLVHDSDDVFC